MKRLDAGDLFFIILGALILALAVSVGMSAYGYVKVPGILLGAAGIALFLVGLLSAGALGAVLGIIAITVIVRLIEAFTMPIAIVLGIAGLAVMIFGFKGTN